MKVVIMFALAVFFISSSASAVVPSPEVVAAIAQCESRGDDYAIGDKYLPPSQQAYGYLQIRQPCLDDVNKRYGTSYKVEDLLGNRELSIWVCERYIDMYATEKRLGRTPTDKDMVRIWNGGPNGWRRNNKTLAYWKKVKRYLA